MHQYSHYMNRWQAVNLVGQRQWFDTEAEAIAYEATGGPMTEYRGFQISPTYQIFRDGQLVFGAWWQRNTDLQAAKDTIDASLDHHPVITALKMAEQDECELENGATARDDADRWTKAQAGGLLL